MLRLINPATEHAFGLNAEHAIGRGADELRLAGILGDRDEEVVTLPWQGTETRWMVRRTSFRQRGVPHTLLLLSDVSSALREEEYRAWQKLIRVLGHELNNSLAPIKSIAGSLRSRVDRNGFPGDDLPDFERGLSVIESRAEALNRFVQGYREFAKLPPPRKRETSIRPLLERVVKLETRLEVQLTTGPDLLLLADPDQLEHMLINLVRNAVEATRERMTEENYRPDVQITWTSERRWARLSVLDNGPGLVNPSNLFVPFYTTKAGGSGVGLQSWHGKLLKCMTDRFSYQIDAISRDAKHKSGFLYVDGTGDSDGHSSRRERDAARKNDAQHRRSLGAERHPNANLVRSARDHKRHHAIDAYCGQSKSHQAECAAHYGDDARKKRPWLETCAGSEFTSVGDNPGSILAISRRTSEAKAAGSPLVRIVNVAADPPSC